MPKPTDGKNPRFRLLCRQCNSYLHTEVAEETERKGGLTVHHGFRIYCRNCGNGAHATDVNGALAEEMPR